MMTWIVLGALSLSPAVPAPVVPAVARPNGPPPSTTFVTADGDGLIALRVTLVNVPETVNETIAQNVGGKVVVVTVQKTVVRLVTTLTNHKVPAGSFDVTDLAGKAVDAEAWQKQIKDGAVVVYASNSSKPDPAYLSVYKAGTLVVVPKPAVDPAPLVPKD